MAQKLYGIVATAYASSVSWTFPDRVDHMIFVEFPLSLSPGPDVRRGNAGNALGKLTTLVD